MPDVKETQAARLDRLLQKALPKVKVGEWGAAGAPYVFDALADGQQRLRVEDLETGERMGFVGTDRDDLLNQFEARVSK